MRRPRSRFSGKPQTDSRARKGICGQLPLSLRCTPDETKPVSGYCRAQPDFIGVLGHYAGAHRLRLGHRRKHPHPFFERIFNYLGAGASAHVLTRPFRREMKARDGFLLVTLVWVVLPLFSCIPLKMSIPGLSFTDAYFEAVSAITTTGGTVLTGLDFMPASINIWRCQMAWMGGMGIIVLAVAILPLLGVGGSQVFKAETPGPLKDNKLTPRITETAKALYLVYFGLSLACVFSFKSAGMSWLDAFLHTGTTMSTSGFSSHDASFAYWNSPAIDTVASVFMMIATVNFSVHFLAWRQRAFTPYRLCPEARWTFLATGASVLLITGYLLAHHTYDNFYDAFRFALFNTVSIASTTGFANTDYNTWPLFAPLLMIFLCILSLRQALRAAALK
ncbi:MAG: hypothetical protein HC848_07205 [Limnobacter sp.]|nr:hypothetical protein [Limnobacter sp.]